LLGVGGFAVAFSFVRMKGKGSVRGMRDAVGFVPLSLFIARTVSVLLLAGIGLPTDELLSSSRECVGHRGLGPQKLDTTSSWRFEAFPVLPKTCARDLTK